MSQACTRHYWVLVYVSPEAIAASSLGRWNIDKEEKLTVSDSTYSSQSLPVLWSGFNQPIIPQQNSTGLSGLKHLLHHLSASLEITLHSNQSKANREFMYQKKKKIKKDSVASSRLKRSLCIHNIYLLASNFLSGCTIWQQHSSLPYRQGFPAHERPSCGNAQKLPNPASGVSQIQNSSTLNRFLSLQFKQGRISAFLSLDVLWASSWFLGFFYFV